MTKRSVPILAVFTVLITLTWFLASLASAATRTVTDCGDTGSPGQLRFLIGIASPGDTIMVPACTIDISGVGLLDITKNLTIQGQGANATFIDGGHFTQVFDVENGVTATLSSMTIRNGNVYGINNLGTLTLNLGKVTGTMGAGIFNGDTLTVTRSTLSGNQGAITNSGTLTVQGSTLSGNTGASFGGAIDNSVGSATVVNTTITGNSATQGGGGIRNAALTTLTLTNSTIASNTAGASGGGGLLLVASGTASLQNPILAGNSTTGSGANCNGLVNSLGHNLSSDSSCLGLVAAGDINSANPLLGPLQNNSGPTQTLALLAGSPAIDAGANAGCPATDQRGVPRPLDAKTGGVSVCDMGAFEVETLKFIVMSFAVNAATVNPGTPLQGTVTVTNGGATRALDVYVFFAPPPGVALGCPNGDPVIFLTTGAFAQSCLSSGVATFTPLLSNVTLAGNTGPVSPTVFGLPWPAGAPTGAWTTGIALTPAGAFFDGRVNPLAEVVIASAPFVAGP
jgi:hypothetical protein